MKKTTLILLLFVSSFCFLTGCITNPYVRTLEEIRNQNISGVFNAYEIAFKGMQVDYIESAKERYKSDREKDLLLNAYEMISKKTPEQLKEEQLFSISDIAILDEVYKKRTEDRIKVINDSFAKFDGIIGNSKITIKQIEKKVEELKKQREQSIKKAATTGLATAAGIGAAATLAP